MIKEIPVPIAGYVNKPDPPHAKFGTLKECNNWLKWRGMLMQPNGPLLYGNAANAHSAIFHRDNNSNGWLIFTNGRNVQKIDDSNNAVSTITANEFAAANLTNLRWPIDRFYQHIFMGTDHDGLHWYYPPGYSGTYTGKAGVTAPANAAVGNSTANPGLTGAYKLVYTFVNGQNHESGPSPASASFCAADNEITWSNIEAGPAGTVSRKLYRTVNDGALYLLLTTIADNTTTSYNDTTSDTSLGAEVDLEGSDVPPTVIRGMAVAGSRLYLLDNASKIWSCKIDSQTALPNWEAYPSSLATQIPAGEASDQVQNIFSLNEIVFAATRNRVFRLVGDPYTGTQVIKVANVGLFNRWSWCYADEDRRYVYMFTSNFKIVRMDQEGNWIELAKDIVTALQAITNYKAPDLGDSVDMSIDPVKGLIYLHCATTGQANHTTFCYDIEKKEWSVVDYGFMISLMDDANTKTIGYEKGVRFVYLGASTYTKNGATYFTNQRLTTYPFFLPGRRLNISRIGVVARTLPRSGGIPPMLKVEYAINNNDVWKGDFVALSNEPNRIGNTGNSVVSQEMSTVYIPVHDTVDSISIRITAPQNAAAIQGFEIYSIFLEVDEAEETPLNKRDADRDTR